MTKPIDHQKLHNLTGQILAHEQAIAALKGDIAKLLGIQVSGDAPPVERKKRGRPAKEAAPEPNAALAQAVADGNARANSTVDSAGLAERALAAHRAAANHDPDRSNPEDADMPDFLKREPASTP